MSNNEIILQLFEECSDNSLHYYDRGNSEQHPPQTHQKRASDNRDDNNKRMNIHRAAKNVRLEEKIIQHVCDYDQNHNIERQVIRIQSGNQRLNVFSAQGINNANEQGRCSSRDWE